MSCRGICQFPKRSKGLDNRFLRSSRTRVEERGRGGRSRGHDAQLRGKGRKDDDGASGGGSKKIRRESQAMWIPGRVRPSVSERSTAGRRREAGGGRRTVETPLYTRTRGRAKTRKKSLWLDDHVCCSQQRLRRGSIWSGPAGRSEVQRRRGNAGLPLLERRSEMLTSGNNGQETSAAGKHKRGRAATTEQSELKRPPGL
jgi:hypothetical protein